MNPMLGGKVVLTEEGSRLQRGTIPANAIGTILEIGGTGATYVVWFMGWACQLNRDHFRLVAPPESWDTEAQAAFFDSLRLDAILANASTLTMETEIDDLTIVLDSREHIDRWVAQLAATPAIT